MRPGNERTWKRRLELLKEAVSAGLEKCKSATSDTAAVELCRLRTTTQRFVEEIRLFIDKMSETEIEEYTNLQLEAELLTSTPQTPPVRENQTKLPKLELPKFRGNLIKWMEFYDRFNSSVNSKNISDADKLTYLQASLEGEALATIRGLDITNENYSVAMQILKERYGKPGSVLDAHYTALMGLKRASSSAKDCLETYNEIERHLRVLKAMGENIGHNNLRTIILSKFPDDLIYELKTKIKTEEETVEKIRKDIEHLITARVATREHQKPSTTIEALHIREKKEFKRKRDYNEKKEEHHKRKRLNPCIFCKGQDHFNDQCNKVSSIKERKKYLKGKCYICFGAHMAKDCKRMRSCYHCKGKHNSALCPSSKGVIKKKRENTSVMLSQETKQSSITLLQTAITTIQGEKYRLLFDTGSQRSYITAEASRKLNLKILEDTVLTIYTFGSQTPQEVESPTTELILHNVRVRLNIVPFITTEVESPNVPMLKKDIRNIKLADNGSLGTHVDILIGNDYYYTFIQPQHIQHDDHLYLVKSVFGWIWSGIQKESSKFDSQQLSLVTYIQGEKTGHSKEVDLPLRESYVHRLWDLETIGITDCPKATRDDQAVEKFNESVLFVNERYWIKWPWTEYPPDLPVNYKLALGRLVGLIRRLDKSTLYEYNGIIQEQLQAGVIEVTSPLANETEQVTPPVHYLPHHIVKQPGKKGRIVYDASSKTKGKNSLNDCMYKGPLLLENLVGLLLRFRTHKYGIMADIEKTFLQLGIQEPDRDVTRFLWLKDVNLSPSTNNLVHLRFCRVPFGIVCSPFLLAIVLKHHLIKLNTLTSQEVARNLYVDNLMTGRDTTEECVQFYKEVRTIFESLSMNLREWYSNNKEFTKHIDKNLIGKEDKRANSLGMTWNLDADTLSLNVKLQHTELKVTKRDVLRQLASIYDPCGFVSPLLLRPKLFLQRLWKEKLDWDTEIPEIMKREWEEIRKNLEETKNIEIARWYGVKQPLNSGESRQELHVFTDASTEAYAAVAYLKIQQKEDVKVTILMSKSRLTPLTDRVVHTIPRLELMGVLIGCRLLNYIKRSLNISITAQYVWTDSQVILCWLNSNRVLPPFVTARVQEIKKTEDTKMMYVPTKMNPADLATLCSNMTQKELWFSGPDFLKKEYTEWPKQTKEHVMLFNDCETLNDKDMKLIKELQAKHFADEINKTTNLTRALGLFLEEGVLRCRGRFKNTDWTVGQKFPILLPKDTEFTREIIEKTHKKLHHAGVSQTLANVRLTFWIPQGRSQVQKVLKHCKQCKKYGGGPYQIPPAPPLPAERVNITPPFTYVGVDYMGPLFVAEEDSSGTQMKRWICLFTCLVVRAIHLEVVKDLSAEECLLALRRFAADRRVPKKILSDNAANFKLTADILKSEYCTENKIEWQFIPELAPWFGGTYERMVGLVKHCLKRTIDKYLLSHSQLTTIVKEVEAVVNARPLTAASADIEHVLTPSDFLRSGGLLTMMDPMSSTQAASTTKRNLIEGWKKGQRLLEEFSKMFQNQYLASLRERSLVSRRPRRGISKVAPKEGDLVQIKDNAPRVKWKVARIFKLIESRDGLIRVAIVKLPNGDTLRRSITHLYPLELDAEEEENIQKERVTERLEKTLDINSENPQKEDNTEESNRNDNTEESNGNGNTEGSNGNEKTEDSNENDKNIENNGKENSEDIIEGENTEKGNRNERELEEEDMFVVDEVMEQEENDMQENVESRKDGKECEEITEVKEKDTPKRRKAAKEAERKMAEWLKLLFVKNIV